MPIIERRDAVMLALRELLAAEQHLHSMKEQNYPVGSSVSWQNGGCTGRVHIGEIIGHGARDRLLVRRARTGATRWITLYDLYEVPA